MVSFLPREFTKLEMSTWYGCEISQQCMASFRPREFIKLETSTWYVCEVSQQCMALFLPRKTVALVSSCLLVLDSNWTGLHHECGQYSPILWNCLLPPWKSSKTGMRRGMVVGGGSFVWKHKVVVLCDCAWTIVLCDCPWTVRCSLWLPLDS